MEVHHLTWQVRVFDKGAGSKMGAGDGGGGFVLFGLVWFGWSVGWLVGWEVWLKVLLGLFGLVFFGN